MKRAFASAVALLVILTACGGDDPAGPGNGNLSNGTFSSNVNGSAFNAAGATATFNGSIVVIAAANAQSHSVGFLFFATGPGTYTLAQTAGNNATYTDGGSSWGAGAGITGSSGSVTFSTLNSSRAAGNFTLTLQPLSGGASGTRTVTGNFDLTIGS